MPENTANPINYKTIYPDSSKPDAEKAAKFLVDFAGGSSITVVMIPVEGKDARGRTFDTSDPKSVNDMRGFIAAYERLEYQVYYMANRIIDGCTKAVPGNEHVGEIRAVVLDFDPHIDPDTGPTLEEERMRLRVLVDNLIDDLKPFAVIDTGGGMQVIFKVKPLAMPLEGHTTRAEAHERFLRHLARSLGADTATCKLKNLFRAPYTYNHPNAKKLRDGRVRSVSGIWHQDDTATTLEELQRWCVAKPEDIDPSAAPTDIDFDGLTDVELVQVLGKPDRLPQYLINLVGVSPGLEAAVKKVGANPRDTSKDDYILCTAFVRFNLSPHDMALLLSAYGSKVVKAHHEKRLFSYIRTTIKNAIKDAGLDLDGFATPAEAEAARQANLDAIRLIGVTEATAGIFDDAEIGVVEGLLPAQGMFVIYGESGSGKTFAALDLAYRVSLGLHWCGRRTTQGVVVYVAAESPRSVRRRLKALVDLHGHSDDFLLLPAVVNMFNRGEGHLRKLGAELDKIGKPIRMIVFDTLARVMAPGNENTTQDMSTLVSNGDHLTARYRTLVGWVHHSGKDKSLGARGSSALRAATDTEVEVGEETSTRVFDVTKLRDGDLFKCGFDLKTVDIGAMKDGTVINTCTVKWSGVVDSSPNDPGANLRDQFRSVLEQLKVPSTAREILRYGKDLGIIKHGTSVDTVRVTISRAIDKDSYFKEFDANEKGEKRYGLLNW